jgi:hypothetical protein
LLPDRHVELSSYFQPVYALRLFYEKLGWK